MDWSHIERRGWRSTKGGPTLEPSRKQEERKTENSWRRSVIKEAARSWNELGFLAADRQKWKRLIDNLCSQKERWTLIIIIIIIIIIISIQYYVYLVELYSVDILHSVQFSCHNSSTNSPRLHLSNFLKLRERNARLREGRVFFSAVERAGLRCYRNWQFCLWA